MKLLTTIAALSLFAASSSFAGPLAALSCKQGATYVTIQFNTMIATASAQKELTYVVEMGELGSNGEVVRKEVYELESNSKIFPSDEVARDFVTGSHVLLPSIRFKGQPYQIVTDVAHQSIDLIVDPVEEKLETFSCLSN